MLDEQAKEKQRMMEAESTKTACNAGFGAGFGAALGGYASLDEPCRVGIRERVEHDLKRANREARKAEQLHELSVLFQRNPEVARILDLVEIVPLWREDTLAMPRQRG